MASSGSGLKRARFLLDWLTTRLSADEQAGVSLHVDATWAKCAVELNRGVICLQCPTPALAANPAPSAAAAHSVDTGAAASVTLSLTAERNAGPEAMDYSSLRQPLLGSQPNDKLREARRVCILNAPPHFRFAAATDESDPVFAFFNACLAPRHKAGVVRVTRASSGTLFIEFVTRALTRAVLRDLEGVLPVAPGVAPTDADRCRGGLVLELSRGADTNPPCESDAVEAAARLGIDTRGLTFLPPQRAGGKRPHGDDT